MQSHSKGFLEEEAGDELREAEVLQAGICHSALQAHSSSAWGQHPRETCNSDSNRDLKP